MLCVSTWQMIENGHFNLFEIVCAYPILSMRILKKIMSTLISVPFLLHIVGEYCTYTSYFCDIATILVSL